VLGVEGRGRGAFSKQDSFEVVRESLQLLPSQPTRHSSNHRGVASSFTVVTGHKASVKRWQASPGTVGRLHRHLVVLMGIGNLENVVDQLITNAVLRQRPLQ